MGSSELAVIAGFLAVIVPILIYVLDYRLKRKHEAAARTAPMDAASLRMRGHPAAVEPSMPQAVDVPVPLPGRLVSGATESLFGFLGRDAQMETLEQVRKQADAGPRLEVAFVTGEAGIGKSTLVAQAALAAHAAGATVLYGHCDDLAVPYQPWLEAIVQLVSHRPSVLRGLPAPQRHAIGRLVPTLTNEILSPPIDPMPSGTSSWRQSRISSRRRRLTAPLVVVLDDLHWADRATLQLFRRLVTAHLAAPIVVIGTYRDTDLSWAIHCPRSSPTFTANPASSASRSPASVIRRSKPCSPRPRATTSATRGPSSPVALQRETAGNPFFTTELLRNLGESGAVYQNENGRWTLREDLAQAGLPSSVREVVGRRVQRLGPEQTRVLSLAAVIGTEFDLGLLDRDRRGARGTLLDLLDGAMNAAVVVETDVAGHYRFAHALVQHTLYGDLGPTRRQRTHLALRKRWSRTMVAMPKSWRSSPTIGSPRPSRPIRTRPSVTSSRRATPRSPCSHPTTRSAGTRRRSTCSAPPIRRASCGAACS